MRVRKRVEQGEHTMKKIQTGHRLDAIQKVQDLEVTIKSRLNINAGLNIRDWALLSIFWKSILTWSNM